MVLPRSAAASSESDPARRSRLLSRILDPEYSGAASYSSPSSFRPLSPSLADLPQPSVFVDNWGHQHDPDFRPFGAYPVGTPAEQPEHDGAWPWDADDDPMPRRSSTIVSRSSSSHYSSSSGSRSRSASILATPLSSPIMSDTDKTSTNNRHRISSPPSKIPRGALFPWTPAQRAVRVQHEVAKRNIPTAVPPPPLEEEDAEIPLALVDSRYVPGYGHVLYPPSPPPPVLTHRPNTIDDVPPPSHKKSRLRSHTVPVPACVRTQLGPDTEDTEQAQDHHHPQSPSCTQSLRQSVYSFGLKTKLGLHHMKVKIRNASGAAARPHSL